MGNGIRWLCVSSETPLGEVLRRLDGAPQRGLPAGIALVVDPAGALLGTVTDGDIRRALLQRGSLELTAGEVMRTDAITFAEGTSFGEILRRLPAELELRGRRSARFLGKIVLVAANGSPARVLDYHQLWEQRVATHRHVTILGMGYVGLTLALVMAESGFRVSGVEVDGDRLERLKRGDAFLHEPGLPELLREQLGASLAFSATVPDESDVFIIAVGTPVVVERGAHLPDLGSLTRATRMVGERLKSGGLVILRSTVPVGTTRGAVVPILEEMTGLRAGSDFHVAFAPERTAEGSALRELRELPQLVGGFNEDSQEATVALFRELTPTIVRVESLEAAELAKLVNNSFRDLSFAFANEVTQLAGRFNLDVGEVIRAANRGYPRDQVPVPSPGVGGPCLSKDPYILAAMAGEGGDSLFAKGRAANEAMPGLIAEEVLRHLEALGKTPAACTLLLCGLAFKGHPETADLRESPALEIARLLRGSVDRLLGHDHVVPAAEVAKAGLEPVALADGLRASDGVLFLNNHPAYGGVDVFAMVRTLRAPGLIYDGWNHFRAAEVLAAGPSAYLGPGFFRYSRDPAP